MPKYGRMAGDRLELSSTQLDGFKPVVYAEIPADFDQTTQYVTQVAPVDKGDSIFVGIEVHELPPDLNEGEGFDENIL